MWRAYLIAPAVAPVSFIILLYSVGAVAYLFDVDVNPASFVVMPVVALTVGSVACYAVAGAIGMPIAFYLRRRKLLNGYTIHLAAFLWAVAFALLCASLIHHGPWSALPVVVAYLACGVTPPVLLSATVFWIIVRREQPSPDSK